MYHHISPLRIPCGEVVRLSSNKYIGGNSDLSVSRKSTSHKTSNHDRGERSGFHFQDRVGTNVKIIIITVTVLPEPHYMSSTLFSLSLSDSVEISNKNVQSHFDCDVYGSASGRLFHHRPIRSFRSCISILMRLVTFSRCRIYWVAFSRTLALLRRSIDMSASSTAALSSSPAAKPQNGTLALSVSILLLRFVRYLASIILCGILLGALAVISEREESPLLS